MPEDVVVFYWVYDYDQKRKGGSNSRKDVKAWADRVNGYVVAEGQSGETKIVYQTRVDDEEEE